MGYDKLVDSVALDKMLTEIADATKTKTVWSPQNKQVVSDLDTEGIYKISFDDLAWRISCIDRLSRMTIYPDGLDNGFYGVLAARCAGTYRAAMVLGHDVFDYNDDANVFNTAINSTVPGKYSAAVRDGEGRGCLDCSSYIGLALRGIPYQRSPFVTHKAPKERWVPSEEMVYGNEGWEFPIIDQQPEKEYRKTGFDGYSSIRGARHQAEFFYKYGYVVYDRDRDGTPTAALQDLVQPGDLIFWSYVDEDGNYNREKVSKSTNNFRSIHHVGMVSERTNYYFQVTGAMDNAEDEDTVCFTAFQNSVFKQISMICRPDYRRGRALAIPKNVNVLGFPWAFASPSSANGITITITGEVGEALHLSGTRTGSSTTPIAIKGRQDDDYSRMRLYPGDYRLYMGGDPDAGIKMGLWQVVDGTASEVASCTGGDVATFTLDEEIDCFVRIYITNGITLDCDITPTLERNE